MKIKIIDEKKYVIEEFKPPENLLFKYIPEKNTYEDMKEFLCKRYIDIDLDSRILPEINKEKAVDTKAFSELDFYIDSYAFDKIFDHCCILAKNGLEAMGYLIGELRKHEGKVFSIVHDVITSDLESTPVSVRFRSDAFKKIFDQLDGLEYDYIIVGWYHSHPGFSSFMSVVDVDTQRRMFNKIFHAALVVDPVNLELKSFRIQDDDCVEIPYAIFEE